MGLLLNNAKIFKLQYLDYELEANRQLSTLIIKKQSNYYLRNKQIFVRENLSVIPFCDF